MDFHQYNAAPDKNHSGIFRDNGIGHAATDSSEAGSDYNDSADDEDAGSAADMDEAFASSSIQPFHWDPVSTSPSPLLFNHKQPDIIGGKAKCEQCGSPGVKHAFYGKTKRFCTLQCSRENQLNRGNRSIFSDNKNLSITNRGALQPALMPIQITNFERRKGPVTLPIKRPIIKQFNKKSNNSHNWANTFNMDVSLEAAPVQLFKHAPLHDVFGDIAVGDIVEIPNIDSDKTNAYWFAVILKTTGYKARCRYEGMGDDGSRDIWVHLCSENVNRVGWCADNNKPLIMPKCVTERKYLTLEEWKTQLMTKYLGSSTLPLHFNIQVKDQLQRQSPFRKDIKLEALNRKVSSEMRLAKVHDVCGGRLKIHYLPVLANHPEEFWCHEKSDIIHPVGWSTMVEHRINATEEYVQKSYEKAKKNEFDEDDARWDWFTKPKIRKMSMNGVEVKFKVGMKFECVHPRNPNIICVCTVRQIMNEGYLMLSADGHSTPDGSDWFCYHSASPLIFPAGFANIHSIPLYAPNLGNTSMDTEGKFNWEQYLKQTKSCTAPLALFDWNVPDVIFREGDKLEAVDLLNPDLMCVGTVTKVVAGRLLRIRFDGWLSEYDQWMDCHSPDIYPVGWCELMGYPLQKPGDNNSQVSRKRRSRVGISTSRKRNRTSSSSASSVSLPGITQPVMSASTSVLPPQTTVSSPTSSGSGEKPHLLQKILEAAPMNAIPSPYMPGSGGSPLAMRSMSGGSPSPSTPPPPPPLTSLPSSLPVSIPPTTLPFSSQAMTVTLAPSYVANQTVKKVTKPIVTINRSPLHTSAQVMGVGVSPHQVIIQSPPPTTTPIRHLSPVIPRLTLPTSSATVVVSSPGGLQPQSRVGSISSTHLSLTSMLQDGGATTSTTTNLTSSPTSQSPPPKSSVQLVKHCVPRISDTTGPINVVPELWNSQKLQDFLKQNECERHCESFIRRKITGKKLLSLNEEQICSLVGETKDRCQQLLTLVQRLKGSR